VKCIRKDFDGWVISPWKPLCSTGKFLILSTELAWKAPVTFFLYDALEGVEDFCVRVSDCLLDKLFRAYLQAGLQIVKNSKVFSEIEKRLGEKVIKDEDDN
jgi:hypothetical protein